MELPTALMTIRAQVAHRELKRHDGEVKGRSFIRRSVLTTSPFLDHFWVSTPSVNCKNLSNRITFHPLPPKILLWVTVATHGESMGRGYLKLACAMTHIHTNGLLGGCLRD